MPWWIKSESVQKLNCWHNIYELYGVSFGRLIDCFLSKEVMKMQKVHEIEHLT